MNKKSVFLIFFTVLSIMAPGQSHLIGLKGGVNFTNISSDALRKTDFKTGFSTGLTYEYFIKPRFSIGADIIYNQLGFSSTIQFANGNGDPLSNRVRSTFYFNYISVPLKAGFTIGKKAFGFGNIGVVPAILIKEKISSTAYGIGDEIGKVNKFDLAGLVDIGGGYKFERLWLFASLAYQHSFTSLTNSDYFSDITMKHYALIHSFGVKYELDVK